MDHPHNKKVHKENEKWIYKLNKLISNWFIDLNETASQCTSIVAC